MPKGNNLVPERTINYRVYNDGNDYLGTAEVELPELEGMTDTVSGAGIAGEVDSPVLGHYASMTLSLTWRTITEYAMELCKPKAHKLECRSSQQVYDASTGEYKTVPVRVVTRATPKNTSLGTLAPSSATDTEQEFEITYLKVVINNKTTVEIDKYNNIAKFGDTDYLASVRADLGLN